jgi:dienelactone hydrolase
MINTVSIDAQGGKMELVLGLPEGKGPFPTLVVAHHRGGLDDFTKKVVERLSAHGFIAAAPHFYHRRPAGEDTGESMKFLDDDEIIADIKTTTAHLQSLAQAKRSAEGMIGHCMGGRHSFLGAAMHPFKAAVMQHPGPAPQWEAGRDRARRGDQLPASRLLRQGRQESEPGRYESHRRGTNASRQEARIPRL